MDAATLDITALPEAYTFEGQPIVEPCYACRSPGFYGDAYYEEGAIIVATIVPNGELQPLNRAAARRYVAWLESLPIKGGETLTIEDLQEAATELRRETGSKELDHNAFHSATMKLALAIKRRREGKDAFFIPSMVTTVGKSDAPPMPNMKYTDPSRRGPGQIGAAKVIHEPRAPGQQVRSARQTAPR